MMQLSVIMLAKWSHLRLRVFLCKTNNTSNSTAFESQDPNMPQIEIFSKMKLEQSLKSLRINADIFEVIKYINIFVLNKYCIIQNFFTKNFSFTNIFFFHFFKIEEWARDTEFTRHSSILKQFTQHAESSTEVVTEDNINRSLLYMQR